MVFESVWEKSLQIIKTVSLSTGLELCWLSTHMGAPSLIHSLFHSVSVWKIKQFDRFDTYFLLLPLLISLDWWRDDGSMIATMFNQKLSMNVQNTFKQTQISFLTLFHFSSRCAHAVVLIALHNLWFFCGDYRAKFLLSPPRLSCLGACSRANQQI